MDSVLTNISHVTCYKSFDICVYNSLVTGILYTSATLFSPKLIISSDINLNAGPMTGPVTYKDEISCN